MKKIALVLLICLMPFALSSCVLSKVTVMRLRGGKIKVPLGSYVPFSGDKIKGVIIRQVWFCNEAGRKVPDLKDILLKEKGAGDSTDDSLALKNRQ